MGVRTPEYQFSTYIFMPKSPTNICTQRNQSIEPQNLYPIERLPVYFNRVVVLPSYIQGPLTTSQILLMIFLLKNYQLRAFLRSLE